MWRKTIKRNTLIRELDSSIFLKIHLRKYNYVELFAATDYLLRAKTSVSLTRDLLLEIFSSQRTEDILSWRVAESKTPLKSQFYIPARKFIYVQPLTYITHSWSWKCMDVVTNASLDGAHASPPSAAKINEETVCLSEYTSGLRDWDL